MRRLFLALTFVTLLIGASVTPAAAGRKWCAKDPIVSLNGVPVQIWIAVPQAYMSAVNGPVVVTIQTPARLSRTVVFTDDGFNRHGERVRFANLPGVSVAEDGSFDVRISAHVPVDGDLLRTLGHKNRQIPVQISITTNGELQFTNGDSPIVQGGESWTVAGTGADLHAIITVHPAPSASRTHAP